jgi:hypothetical protein
MKFYILHILTWEANRFSASQEIVLICMEPESLLLRLQVHATVLILYQINPVHATTYHFLEIQLNIILQSEHWF